MSISRRSFACQELASHQNIPRAFALGVPCYSFICARSGRTKGTSPCLGKPYWPYHNRPPASGPNRPAGALARKMYPPVTALAGDAPRQPPLGKGAIGLVSVQAQNTPRTFVPSGCRKAFPAHGEGGPLAVDEVPAKRIKDSIVSGQVGRGTVPCPIGGARNHPLSHFCMLSSSRRGGVGMRSKTKAPSPCLN